MRLKSCFMQTAWPTLPVIKTSRYLERFYWNLPEQHREVVNKKEDTWIIHGEGAEYCLHSLWEGVLAVRDSDGGTLFLPESEVQSMKKTVYTTKGWGYIKIIWSNDNLQISGMHWGLLLGTRSHKIELLVATTTVISLFLWGSIHKASAANLNFLHSVWDVSSSYMLSLMSVQRSDSYSSAADKLPKKVAAFEIVVVTRPSVSTPERLTVPPD